MRITLVLIIALLIAGCVGSKVSVPSWQRVDPERSQYTGKLGFTAGLPVNWMVYEDMPSRMLLLTRHSVPMDFIQIRQYALSEPLPHTDLALEAGMRTYELAEIIINNLRAMPGVFDLTVEELAPDEIDGREAFRMMASYAMENGIRRRCLIYGFISGSRHYTEIGLYALEEHYFGAAIEEFLTLTGTFRVKN